MAADKLYKRILLKLSGEALTGQEAYGIDPKVLDQLALEIGQLVGIWRPNRLGGGRRQPVSRCRT
jgi:uridylate kinase